MRDVAAAIRRNIKLFGPVIHRVIDLNSHVFAGRPAGPAYLDRKRSRTDAA